MQELYRPLEQKYFDTPGTLESAATFHLPSSSLVTASGTSMKLGLISICDPDIQFRQVDEDVVPSDWVEPQDELCDGFESIEKPIPTLKWREDGTYDRKGNLVPPDLEAMRATKWPEGLKRLSWMEVRLEFREHVGRYWEVRGYSPVETEEEREKFVWAWWDHVGYKEETDSEPGNVQLCRDCRRKRSQK
ncbi:hypothetical protein BJ508DRAFT_311839 [Ascobolus immersus RN42]|uniref:Uncharacterized protein n=1 Tax=Ascobolus immersus RN42 TaxID=1160509 RepID=A0A3N4HRD2_ASCIM|nr:hypothetical protein BJ508DRAFT_311839 [Ascobolus immersus RN42]